jgi:hypothetical protein
MISVPSLGMCFSVPHLQLLGLNYYMHIFPSVLRRTFGPKKDEVTGGWRKLYNKELHDFYSSPSIIKIIKSRRMR